MPVNASRELEARAAIAVLGCTIPPKSATYLSGPITMGLRYLTQLERLRSRRSGDKNYLGVRVDPAAKQRNVLAMRRFAARLRTSTQWVVIDPSRFEPHGWSQAEFHEFWKRVIDLFAERVVLIAGWQYSRGCVREFRSAVEAGVCILDQKLSEMAPIEGEKLIAMAKRRYSKVGIQFHE